MEKLNCSQKSGKDTEVTVDKRENWDHSPQLDHSIIKVS